MAHSHSAKLSPSNVCVWGGGGGGRDFLTFNNFSTLCDRKDTGFILTGCQQFSLGEGPITCSLTILSHTRGLCRQEVLLQHVLSPCTACTFCHPGTFITPLPVPL